MWYYQVKFLTFFAAIYCVLHGAYLLIPDEVLKEKIYYQGIVSISAELINLFSNEHVNAHHNILSSSKAALEVVRGCDGAGTLFLIIAATIAFSCSIKHKLVGLLSGVALVYLLNQIRIVGLYFVVAYQRSWFEPIHTYFAPSLIVLICILYFAWWSIYGQAKESQPQADESA